MRHTGMNGRQLACALSLAFSGCVVINASESGGRPDPVRLGQPLTYTITVEAVTADTGIVLTDMPPAGAAPVSASASQGTCSGARPPSSATSARSAWAAVQR